MLLVKGDRVQTAQGRALLKILEDGLDVLLQILCLGDLVGECEDVPGPGGGIAVVVADVQVDDVHGLAVVAPSL